MGHVVTETSTYTGDIVQFNAGASGGDITSLITNITPSQSLNGYSNPWPEGGGLNKWPEYTTDTQNQVTLTNDHGEVTINGTASADTYFDLTVNYTIANGQTYYIYAFNPSASTSNRLTLFAITSGGNPQVNLNNANASYSATLTSDITVTKLRIRVPSGVQYTNFKLKPYFQIGGTAPTSWTPYANLCPISGRTGLSVYRTGKNLVGITLSQHNANTLKTNVFCLPKGTFAISVGSSITLGGMYLRSGSTLSAPTIAQIYNSNTLTVTLTEAYSELILQLYKGNGVLVSDIEYVQIEADSATTYEPYNGTTYSVDWSSHGTVYGGTVDVVTGELTVNKAYALLNDPDKWVESNTNEFRYEVQFTDRKTGDSYAGLLCSYVGIGSNSGRWVSTSSYKFLIKNLSKSLAEVKQDATDGNIAICYELATPQTVQLTAQQISALNGLNNVWVDSGNPITLVLASVVAGFRGWLIKAVTNGTPIEIPLKYMRAETYSVTPDQRMEWSAERDVTGVLHRETVQNLPPKIEFNTPLMENADINALNTIIRNAFTNYLQRNITIQFYDPERDEYWEWDCYMPDVKYVMRNVDTVNHIVNYEETRYAFIGY